MLFYFVGIKGSALSALAKILLGKGHIVRGVDVEEDFYTLKNTYGIKIESFSNMNLKKSYYYIIGNAYQKHSVTSYIKRMHYKWDTYPQFLSKFFHKEKWICIAGTSGKTTTTKMISTILPQATSLIGDGSCQLGTEDIFVLESCEYKDTFLNYSPKISLILNVNYDHVDYFKTKESYEKSFIQFANQSQICVVNGDEFSYRANHIITYGMKKENDIVFTYDYGKVTILRSIFFLPVLGLKYAYDFVGAYVVAKLLNGRDDFIQMRIQEFSMPKRRLEKTVLGSQVIISDYAHHPNEVESIFESVEEQYPQLKKICIFEPHTLSRLQYFLQDYKRILKQFDEAYMYPLFSSARETHNLVLEQALYKELELLPYDYHTKRQLQKQKNAVVCFLGAGVIDRAVEEYKKEFQLS